MRRAKLEARKDFARSVARRDADLKECSSCKKDLPLSAFGRDANRQDGRQPWCRKCFQAYYRRNRVEVTRECVVCGMDFVTTPRSRKLTCSDECRQRRYVPVPPRELECVACRSTFMSKRSDSSFCRSCKDLSRQARLVGLTPREFWLKREAAVVCAACSGAFNGTFDSKPVADHDHTTKKFRGFTHSSCNCGIGQANDEIERLFGWQTYLARHQFDLRDLVT